MIQAFRLIFFLNMPFCFWTTRLKMAFSASEQREKKLEKLYLKRCPFPRPLFPPFLSCCITLQILLTLKPSSKPLLSLLKRSEALGCGSEWQSFATISHPLTRLSMALSIKGCLRSKLMPISVFSAYARWYQFNIQRIVKGLIFQPRTWTMMI